MHYFEPSDTLRAFSMMTDYNPEIISKYVKSLKAENMLI